MKIVLSLILIISTIIFSGWIIDNKDITYFLVGVGSQMKMYTSLYFILITSALLLIEINPLKYRHLIMILKRTVLFFSFLVLATPILLYGINGIFKLGTSESMFFDFPSIPTLINFISLSGFLFLLLNRHKIKFQRNWLIYFIFINSFLTLLTYSIHNKTLSFIFQNDKIVGMAFITSFFFFVLSLMGIFRIKERKMLTSLKKELR